MTAGVVKQVDPLNKNKTNFSQKWTADEKLILRKNVIYLHYGLQ